MVWKGSLTISNKNNWPEVPLVQLYAALLQIPGMDTPTLTWQEQAAVNWEGMGFMRWPLAFCLGLGIIVIIIKFVTLTAKEIGRAHV